MAATDRNNVLHLWSSDGSNHLSIHLPYVASALLVEGPSSVVIERAVDRWEVLDEQSAQPAPFDGQETDVTVLDSTPAGNLLAAAGTDGRVVVWDLPSRRQRAVWRIGTEVTALRFDPTGRNLWAATDDGELRSFYVDGEHEEGSPLQARPGRGRPSHRPLAGPFRDADRCLRSARRRNARALAGPPGVEVGPTTSARRGLWRDARPRQSD